VSPRDLDEWQLALDEADADLQRREQASASEDMTPQESRALAAEHDKLAADRDALADARDEQARSRDAAALDRDLHGSHRDRAARDRAEDQDEAFADRFHAAVDRDLAAGDRSDSVDDRRRAAEARRVAASNRQRAADDRDAAATRDDEMRRELATLQTALDTRLRIGQAQGLLMARHGLDSDGAFRLLARLSCETHLTLADLADQLVAESAQRMRRAPQ
jgi:hypothetical protein